MPYLRQQTATPDANVSANDLATQIRAQVNAQLKQAGVEQQKAQSNADRAPQGANQQVTITKNGKTVTIHPGTGQVNIAPVAPIAPIPIAPIEGVTSTGIPDDQPFDIPQRVENLGYAFFLMLAVIAVGKPLARAFGNIVERRAIKPSMPPEFGGRLERIEQGIEAVSIEIERISESQRYLLKVQSPTPERVELPRSAS